MSEKFKRNLVMKIEFTEQVQPDGNGRFESTCTCVWQPEPDVAQKFTAIRYGMTTAEASRKARGALMRLCAEKPNLFTSWGDGQPTRHD